MSAAATVGDSAPRPTQKTRFGTFIYPIFPMDQILSVGSSMNVHCKNILADKKQWGKCRTDSFKDPLPILRMRRERCAPCIIVCMISLYIKHRVILCLFLFYNSFSYLFVCQIIDDLPINWDLIPFICIYLFILRGKSD